VKFYASLGKPRQPQSALLQAVQHGGEAGITTLRTENAEILRSGQQPTWILPNWDWVKQKLRDSTAALERFVTFHHPLYSDGKFHGSDKEFAGRGWNRFFLQNGVNVVFSGHDHVYERFKPQNGIDYFVLGSSGQFALRQPEILCGRWPRVSIRIVLSCWSKIAGDQLYFQTISRGGQNGG